MFFLILIAATIPKKSVVLRVGGSDRFLDISFATDFAIDFGEGVEGIFADRIEEGLEVAGGVLMDDYEFTIFIKHFRCDNKKSHYIYITTLFIIFNLE